MQIYIRIASPIISIAYYTDMQETLETAHSLCALSTMREQWLVLAFPDCERDNLGGPCAKRISLGTRYMRVEIETTYWTNFT
jgi:hypothetical protein